MRLKLLAKECGVCSNVAFVGAVTHADIYNVYAASDILLSLYDMSNVGNPLWEAMNAGRCIVTLDAGNTREVIEDGVNGRIIQVSVEDDILICAIADAITELIEKPSLRKRLAEGAKAYASKHLMTWEQRLQAELDAILKLGKRRDCGVL
jgi:glycosyltransferase involved in cell wall biosynthesis